MAMILVSHDLGVVAQNCDRVAVMYAGHVVEDAPAVTLFAVAAPPVHGAPARGRCRRSGRRPRRPACRRSAASRPTSPRLPPGCPFRPALRSMSATPCTEVTMELMPAGPGQLTACPFWREAT